MFSIVGIQPRIGLGTLQSWTPHDNPPICCVNEPRCRRPPSTCMATCFPVLYPNLSHNRHASTDRWILRPTEISQICFEQAKAVLLSQSFCALGIGDRNMPSIVNLLG